MKKLEITIPDIQWNDLVRGLVMAAIFVAGIWFGGFWNQSGSSIVPLKGEPREYLSYSLENYHNNRTKGVDKPTAVEAFIVNTSAVLKLPESNPQPVEMTITVPKEAEPQSEEQKVDKKYTEPPKKYKPRQRPFFRILR